MNRLLLIAPLIVIALWSHGSPAQTMPPGYTASEELLMEANRRVVFFGDQVRALREENARLKAEIEKAKEPVPKKN
jgi:hypothetical protein